MSERVLTSLAQVVEDKAFPLVDLALRRGQHLDREDGDLYDLVLDGEAVLAGFYEGYRCRLIRAPEGYVYLLPSGERLGRRHLSAGEMLLGQVLALAYLDPSHLLQQRTLPRDEAFARLSHLVGEERLVRTLLRGRRSRNQRVAEEAARKELERALRGLCALGFVDLVQEDRLRLRPSLLRFAAPARDARDPIVALTQLISRGELALEAQEPAADEETAGEDVEPEVADEAGA